MSASVEYPFMNGMCLPCEKCNPKTLTCSTYRIKCFRVKVCNPEMDLGVSDDDIKNSSTHQVFTAENLPYCDGVIVHKYECLYGKFTEEDFKTKWDLK